MWDDSIKSIETAILFRLENKDLIVFAGWEWTQMGPTPDNHYGHKNVILRDLKNIPDVPIGAGLTGLDLLIENDLTPFLPLVADFPPESIDFDFLKFRDESYSIPFCDQEFEEGKECKDELKRQKLFSAKLMS